MLALPSPPTCCENGTPEDMCPNCKKQSYFGYWLGYLRDSDFDEDGHLTLSDEEFHKRYLGSDG